MTFMFLFRPQVVLGSALSKYGLQHNLKKTPTIKPNEDPSLLATCWTVLFGLPLLVLLVSQTGRFPWHYSRSCASQPCSSGQAVTVAEELALKLLKYFPLEKEPVTFCVRSSCASGLLGEPPFCHMQAPIWSKSFCSAFAEICVAEITFLFC